VTILGNAIENAIEANEPVEHDSRYIHLKASITAQNALLINIINPYVVAPVADKDGNLMTTKADKRNHGLGLASISEFMPEEKGQVHFEFADNVFKFMAVFYDILE
jgi:sensor histidine kinase regulating citrate/malate metabolism